MIGKNVPEFITSDTSGRGHRHIHCNGYAELKQTIMCDKSVCDQQKNIKTESELELTYGMSLMSPSYIVANHPSPPLDVSAGLTLIIRSFCTGGMA